MGQCGDALQIVADLVSFCCPAKGPISCEGICTWCADEAQIEADFATAACRVIRKVPRMGSSVLGAKN